METRKLYYEDCHLRDFSARVLSCQRTDKGYAVILDATAFYPEGGGQPCDRGVLGGAAVMDVRERDGQIIHLCDAPLEALRTVEGHIDWERRFALMQQHTGEHIVSGIVHRLFGWHNVGFHMGSETVTIDFDGPVPGEALAQIEREANEIVWKNLPIHCWYPEEEALSRIPYRTKKQLPWPVRIVQIPEADSCACCGVHVAATGEIGLIKLFSCVKFHQGVRIEMACGSRALAYLNSVYEQNRQVSRAFSAKPLETGAAARKINEALAAEKYRSAGLERQLLDHVAARYAGQRDVVHFEEALSPVALRELAERIAGVCGGVAAVFSGREGRYDVCLAGPGAEVKELGSRMAQTLQGRGGGKPGFYQGSVTADKESILRFFRNV